MLESPEIANRRSPKFSEEVLKDGRCKGEKEGQGGSDGRWKIGPTARSTYLHRVDAKEASCWGGTPGTQKINVKVRDTSRQKKKCRLRIVTTAIKKKRTPRRGKFQRPCSPQLTFKKAH